MKNIIINLIKCIALTVAFNLMISADMFFPLLMDHDLHFSIWIWLILFIIELIITIVWYKTLGHFLNYHVNKMNIRIALSLYVVIMIIASIAIVCFIPGGMFCDGLCFGLTNSYHKTVELFCESKFINASIGNSLAYIIEYVFKALCLYFGYINENKPIKD